MGEESETHYLGMRLAVGPLRSAHLTYGSTWIGLGAKQPDPRRTNGGWRCAHPTYDNYAGTKETSRGAAARGGKTETTAMAAAQNLQDTFLNHVRKNKIPLTIFLVNGVKLQGVVTWFDNFCVLLRRDGHSQLVYKHAISTIMPGHPVQLFEGAEEPPGPEKT
jgi:host factor-I protein